MGSLLEQIYHYTRPRTYRRDENLWLFTRIMRVPSSEISALRCKGRMVPLVSLNTLKNSMQDEVLLTATDPSTRNIGFSPSSKAVPVMGANGAWHLVDRLHFPLYTIVDMEFFDKKPDIIRAVVSQPEVLLFTAMYGIAKILGRYEDTLRCCLALIEDSCYKIHQPRVASEAIKRTYQQNAATCLHPQRLDIYFSTDIHQGIFNAGTVIYWVLQILAWLGFNTILVGGLGMANFNQPRFYETQQEKSFSYLAAKVGTLVMPSFARAAQVLQQRQAQVISFSSESAVPNTTFERVAFNEYSKNK